MCWNHKIPHPIPTISGRIAALPQGHNITEVGENAVNGVPQNPVYEPEVNNENNAVSVQSVHHRSKFNGFSIISTPSVKASNFEVYRTKRQKNKQTLMEVISEIPNDNSSVEETIVLRDFVSENKSSKTREMYNVPMAKCTNTWM